MVAAGRWFVKQWRNGRPPERLGLLAEFRSAGLPVPAPLLTIDGELWARWGDRPYAVFPFVTGRTAGDDDWRVTARA